MVRGFLLLTFLAASAVSGENDAVARIAAIEARIGGRIGVAPRSISVTANVSIIDKTTDFRCAAHSNFSRPRPY
jgi:hypothetical protein